MPETHAQIQSYLASCHFDLGKYKQALEAGKRGLQNQTRVDLRFEQYYGVNIQIYTYLELVDNGWICPCCIIFCLFLKQNIVLPFVIKVQFFQPVDKAEQTYDYWNAMFCAHVTGTLSNTWNRWSVKYCSFWPKIMYILWSVDTFIAWISLRFSYAMRNLCTPQWTIKP